MINFGGDLNMKKQKIQQKPKNQHGVKTTLIDAHAYDRFGVFARKEAAEAA